MTDADRLTLAAAYLDAGRPRDALPLLQNQIASSPEDFRAYCLLSQANAALDNRLAALEAAQRAVELRPNDEFGWRLQSLAHVALRQFESARRAAAQARNLRPDSWRTHLNVASVDASSRHITRDTHEALAFAKRLAPQSVQVHLVSGGVALAEGKKRAARSAYETALSLDPSNAVARHNLAVAMMGTGTSGSSAATFVELLGEGAQSPLALSNLRVLARNTVRIAHFIVWFAVLAIWLTSLVRHSMADPATYVDGQKPTIAAVLALALIVIAVIFLRFRATARSQVGKFIRGVAQLDPPLVVWSAFVVAALILMAVFLAIPAELAVSLQFALVVPVVAGTIASRVSVRRQR